MQLEVSDLVFSYGEADVLKSVSFCADRGERIAVLGPNGVGKSTLFRCLLGFLKPKRGSVKIAGLFPPRAGGGACVYSAVLQSGVRPYGARQRSDGPWCAAWAV